MNKLMTVAVVVGVLSVTMPVWALDVAIGGGVESAAETITYTATMHPFTWTDAAVLGTLGLVQGIVTPQNYGLGVGAIVGGLVTWGAWRTQTYRTTPHAPVAALTPDGTFATSLALNND